MPYITTAQGISYYTGTTLANKDILNRPYDKDDGQLGLITPTTARGWSNVAALTASRAYIGRFTTSRSILVTKIDFLVTVAAGADDACDVGILSGDLATKVVSSGATTGKLNATGVKSISITPTLLLPRVVYYSAFSVGTFGSTAATLAVLSVGSSAIVDLMGTANGTREFSFQAGAHPLAVPFTPAGVTANAILLALKE